jgi:O-succinylbenzoic acid--CoA ligase
LPIALTYGMTETAAMVAAIRPEDVLRGERTGAKVLSHARMEVASDGTIGIEGTSVFRGYFPELNRSRRFETEDLGRIDEQGRVHILGRKDAAIITGGKKVQPVEVEAVLRQTGQFSDIAVIGVPDRDWGEAVVACYPRTEATQPDLAAVERHLSSALAPYQRPKHYVPISAWPRNAQGKLNRAELGRRVLVQDGREQA